jgi:hypothetical protein
VARISSGPSQKIHQTIFSLCEKVAAKEPVASLHSKIFHYSVEKSFRNYTLPRSGIEFT